MSLTEGCTVTHVSLVDGRKESPTHSLLSPAKQS